jgi:hypothetical protein
MPAAGFLRNESATGRGIVSRWENGVAMDKKKKEKKSVKSSRRTPLRQKQKSHPSDSLRSVDNEGMPTRKPRPKSTVPAKVGADDQRVAVVEVVAAPPSEVDIKRPMSSGEPNQEATSPRKRGFQPKKYFDETPEERRRRHAQYVRESRQQQKLEEAQAQGFDTAEDYKMFRQRARRDMLFRAKMEIAKNPEAYALPPMSAGEPHKEATSQRKKKYRTKRHNDESPEERSRRQSQYVAELRQKQKLEEAQALGFATIEDHKIARRHARQDKHNLAEIQKAKNRGAYSKLTLVRRALASLAAALNAEFNKPHTERGNFREIKFRIRHLANIEQILS